ncbi:hypothetical protein ACS0TY_008992 [Phlomoides rotata]
MAAVSFTSSTISSSSHLKSRLKLPYPRTHSSSLQSIPILTKSKISLSIQNLRQFKFLVTRAKSGDLFEEIETEETLLGSDGKPVKFLLLVLLWASVSIGLYAFSGDAKAAATVAADSIRASGGLRFGPKRLHLTILSVLGSFAVLVSPL